MPGATNEGEENNPSVFLSVFFLSGTHRVVTLSLLCSGYLVVFLLLFFSSPFSFVEERHITDNDDAAVTDGFDTQFPPHFEDELTSEQGERTRRKRRRRRRTRRRRKRRRRMRMRKLRIYMSLVDKRSKLRFVWDNDICAVAVQTSVLQIIFI